MPRGKKRKVYTDDIQNDYLPELPNDRKDCELGVCYFDMKRGFKVVAYRNGGGFQLFRVCEEEGCRTCTINIDEAFCWQHDGPGKCVVCEERVANKEKKTLCAVCYVAKCPDAACPRCKSEPASENDDRLCGNCVVTQGTAAKREAGEAAAKKMAEELGLPCTADFKKGEKPQPKTRYVRANLQKGWEPCEMVWEGRQFFLACGTPGCTSKAAEGGFCYPCGGGVRCIGANPPGEPHVPCSGNTLVNASKDKKYDGRCVQCFCATFPNDPRAINAGRWFKAKEQATIKALMECFPQYDWTLDRRFAKGVLQRPDAMVRDRKRIVIVEIDEKSHRNATCDEEREREELFEEYKPRGATIAMIRFNPDEYTCGYDGLYKPSCFKRSRDDSMVIVDPDQREEWQKRLEVLMWRVGVFLDPEDPEYYTEVPPAPEGRVFYMEELFYDNVKANVSGEDRAKAKRYYTRLGKRRAVDTSRAHAQAAAMEE